MPLALTDNEPRCGEAARESRPTRKVEITGQGRWKDVKVEPGGLVQDISNASGKGGLTVRHAHIERGGNLVGTDYSLHALAFG